MRPSLLNPLFASLTSLPGVGSRIEALIARAVGADGDDAVVRDLLFHLPNGFVDRRNRPPLYQLPPSGYVTVEGVVERHEQPRPGSAAPWRVILAEGNAAIQLVYFNPRADWLKKIFPLGARRSRERRGRVVRHAPADRASRICAGPGACGRAAAARAGLWPHRRASLRRWCGGPWRRRWSELRRCRNGFRRTCLPRRAGRAFPRR